MDFNGINNKEFENENNINEENNKKNNNSDELLDEIDNKNNKNENRDEIINNNIENNYHHKENNINVNENKEKENEDFYKNSDINDFSNPFKDFQEEKENNYNNLDINYNNENSKINNDKQDNDFINPFKDYNFNNKFSNDSNPYSINHKENNNIEFDNFNNNINNNYKEYINPYNDNNYKNEDNDFSNPFKDEFDINKNNEDNKNVNNQLLTNQNNNNQNFINNQNYNNNNPNINHYPEYNNINNNNFNNNFYRNKTNNNINNINNTFTNQSNNPNKQFNINNIDISNQNEIKNDKVSKDFKTIENIIKKCESLYYSAKSNYENYKIKEAISTLKKIINTLNSVKTTIKTQKNEFSPFIPQINMLENVSTTTLYNYKMNLYEAIDTKYKSINPNQFKNNESLIDFCSKFILYNPFITFDDIYNNNNMIDGFMEKLNEARIHQKKCILLYGDRGSGKSLLVHACAQKMGGSVAQIERDQFLKIPFFAREFMKVCFKNIGYNKPLFVYMKNIEYMFSCRNQFDFIYDKVASSFNLNIYFIASTNIDLNRLPKDIYHKFQFFHEVKTVENKNKSDFMRFICDKCDIKLNVNLIEFNNFINQNLDNFPNKKIFELIKCAINIKKQKTMPSDEPNWVYKEGLNLLDLTNALSGINPFL